MYTNILFPIDLNDKKSWKAALPQVINLCKSSPECKLILMTAVQTYGLGMIEEYFPKGWAREVSKKSKDKLTEIVERYVPQEVQTQIIVEKGVVYQSIIDLANNVDADLIVMTAHHPDRSDYLLGPNVAKVVRHSDISVLVLRD